MGGKVVKTINPGLTTPYGLAFDGRSLWVADGGQVDQIAQVNPDTGAVVRTLAGPAGLRGLTWDGSHLWAVGQTGNVIVEVSPEII